MLLQLYGFTAIVAVTLLERVVTMRRWLQTFEEHNWVLDVASRKPHVGPWRKACFLDAVPLHMHVLSIHYTRCNEEVKQRGATTSSAESANCSYIKRPWQDDTNLHELAETQQLHVTRSPICARCHKHTNHSNCLCTRVFVQRAAAIRPFEAKRRSCFNMKQTPATPRPSI